MYNEFLNDLDRFIKTPKFIHLTRNLNNQAYSCIRNSSLREQHPEKYQAFLLEGMQWQLPTQDFEAPPATMDKLKWQIKKLKRRVKYQLSKVDVLEITYEQISNGSESVKIMPHQAAEAVCSFLQVERADLRTTMIKIAPQKVRLRSA